MNHIEQGEGRSVGGLDTKIQFKFELKRRKKTAWMRSLIFVVLLGMLLSCSKPPQAQNATNDPQSAATYISRADQFYSQREDLTRLQQGIVLLRQAITADPSNYDAAWQLAKFNYYLATHVEAYQAVGRSADARQQLNTILSMTPDPNYLPELKEAQTQARQMLDKIK
jgi:Tfp pilus assembly protein PilF